jgi:hypothetical protein
MHINKILEPYRKKEKHRKCPNEREKTKGRDGGVCVPVYEGRESDGEVGRNGFSGG